MADRSPQLGGNPHHRRRKGGELRGFGWNLMTDKEVEFAVDLRTGAHTGGGY